MPGPRIDARALPSPTPAIHPPVYPAALVYPPGTVPAYALTDSIPFAATPELVQALRAELAMRAHAEAGLRARAVDAETRLATRVLLSQRTAEALRLVRDELAQLGGLLTDERARRQAAERRVAELEQELATDRGRSDDADREIVALRESLQQLRTPVPTDASAVADAESPGDAPHGALAEVRADRLNDALTRLRAGTEPIDPLPAPAAPTAPTPATISAPTRQATLAGPFRRLCRRDPELAGRIALSLLPMQWTAYPHPVSYDIVLGLGHGCVQVTSADGDAAVARHATARPPEQVDFQLVGGTERFAKLLAAGRIRRRLGFWVVSRVRGNRDGLAALDALLGLPLELPALVDGGISTDPLVVAQLQSWVKRAQSE